MTSRAHAAGAARGARQGRLPRCFSREPGEHLTRTALPTAAFLICLGLGASATAQETSAAIIAAHVRLQGYACDQPKSARRDLKASRPDEAVWLIDCKTARYRVRLVPDMADVIQPF